MTETRSGFSRRHFLQGSVGSLAALSSLRCATGPTRDPEPAAPSLPRRPLGRTGLEVSLLTFGGGSQFLKNDDGQWEPLLEKAVDLGINLFDTCSNYQWGASLSSEERFGEILPRYRDRILLSTKVVSRDPAEACREFELSLERMKTDHVDILMLHSVEPSEDLAAFEKGVYRELVRLKDQGATRCIGFSSMNSAERSKELLERLDVDVALLAMNPTGYGDFVTKALPVAAEKNVGVLAMKVVRDLVGPDATAADLLQYAWTRPGVASALIGHYGAAPLEENARLAAEFDQAEQVGVRFDGGRLEQRLAHLAGPHALCWARPGYSDGIPC